jgi:hypothetical protein
MSDRIFQVGDTVEFLVPFENADARIEPGEIGQVRTVMGLGYVTVVAKGIRWMCRHPEIRKVQPFQGPKLVPERRRPEIDPDPALLGPSLITQELIRFSEMYEASKRLNAFCFNVPSEYINGDRISKDAFSGVDFGKEDHRVMVWHDSQGVALTLDSDQVEVMRTPASVVAMTIIPEKLTPAQRETFAKIMQYSKQQGGVSIGYQVEKETGKQSPTIYLSNPKDNDDE